MPAVVVDATRADRAIGPDVFLGITLTDHAVLVRTNFSRYWGAESYFSDHPFLSTHSAEVLVTARPSFVGIDSLTSTTPLTRHGPRTRSWSVRGSRCAST